MHPAPPAPRTRRLRAVALALGLTLLVTGCDRYRVWQDRTRELVNESRDARDRRRLPMQLAASGKAQRWAEHLAACRCLEHSRLSGGIPGPWRAIAENVGRGGAGGTLPMIHRAFMQSAHHRENILGRWSVVGVGVASRGTEKFVVHVFVRY